METLSNDSMLLIFSFLYETKSLFFVNKKWNELIKILICGNSIMTEEMYLDFEDNLYQLEIIQSMYVGRIRKYKNNREFLKCEYFLVIETSSIFRKSVDSLVIKIYNMLGDKKIKYKTCGNYLKIRTIHSTNNLEINHISYRKNKLKTVDDEYVDIYDGYLIEFFIKDNKLLYEIHLFPNNTINRWKLIVYHQYMIETGQYDDDDPNDYAFHAGYGFGGCLCCDW